MPFPFWSAEREQKFIKDFGGRDTPGYVRNVMGDWGDAEDPVFRWADIRPNLVDLPAFRSIELLWDAPNDALSIVVKRIQLAASSDGHLSATEDWLQDASLEADVWKGPDEQRATAWRTLLSPWITQRAAGVYWAGADLGERNDPTRIVISEQVGDQLVDCVRVSAKGFAYHLQCELIDTLDSLFGRRAFWGVDMGSAGTAVLKDLQSLDRFVDADFEARMTGFHFQQAVECRDEDGNALTEVDPKGDEVVVTAPAKHWSTQMVVSRLQRAGYAMAFEPSVINDMTSHTARAGARWPIYAKTNDHDIDARRQQMLRKLFNEDHREVDIFSSSLHQRDAA
jgi:hypothetical protein